LHLARVGTKSEIFSCVHGFDLGPNGWSELLARFSFLENFHSCWFTFWSSSRALGPGPVLIFFSGARVRQSRVFSRNALPCAVAVRVGFFLSPDSSRLRAACPDFPLPQARRHAVFPFRRPRLHPQARHPAPSLGAAAGLGLRFPRAALPIFLASRRRPSS
jgi:hypothetical protein